jgi:DNA-directed RNA polymerase specialized sigma24 family protein
MDDPVGFLYRTAMNTFLKRYRRARRASTGWDGGIYRAWTDGSHTAVVLRTVWDTPDDAQEFADAMKKWIGNGTAFVHDPVGARVDVGFASDCATLGVLESALT